MPLLPRGLRLRRRRSAGYLVHSGVIHLGPQLPAVRLHAGVRVQHVVDGFLLRDCAVVLRLQRRLGVPWWQRGGSRVSGGLLLPADLSHCSILRLRARVCLDTDRVGVFCSVSRPFSSLYPVSPGISCRLAAPYPPSPHTLTR